jgi:hypothetical protein
MPDGFWLMFFEVKLMKFGWRQPEMNHMLSDKVQKTSNLEMNFMVV